MGVRSIIIIGLRWFGWRCKLGSSLELLRFHVVNLYAILLELRDLFKLYFLVALLAYPLLIIMSFTLLSFPPHTNLSFNLHYSDTTLFDLAPSSISSPVILFLTSLSLILLIAVLSALFTPPLLLPIIFDLSLMVKDILWLNWCIYFLSTWLILIYLFKLFTILFFKIYIV